MTPLCFGLCVRRRGQLSVVVVVQQTVIGFVTARGLHASWIRLCFWTWPDRTEWDLPARSLMDQRLAGCLVSVVSMRAFLWNTVCKLLHAITEISASGSSLSLELFCRSNFILQTQVYFPPPPSGLCSVSSHFSVNLTCQFGWCVASFVKNVLKCWLWDKCCFPFVKILCRKHI